ncbi:MAG: hypothetical protein Q3976_07275 [Corynebacterium sp.]|nr:hypothetical protein [Corynebacterium sp.]
MSTASLLAVQTPGAFAQSAIISDSLAEDYGILEDLPDLSGSDFEYAASEAEKIFTENAVLEDGESVGDIDIAKKLSDDSFFVSAPIEGAAKGSVISASKTAEGKSTTFQISLHEINETSGTLTTYSDGEVGIARKVVEAEPAVDASNVIAPRGMNWGALNRCLSNAGIAAWTITGLSLACGVACAATAGTACLACLTAASGATGGTVGYCVGNAWE